MLVIKIMIAKAVLKTQIIPTKKMDFIGKKEVQGFKITLEVVRTRSIIEITVVAVIVARKVKIKRIFYLRKGRS